MAEPEKRERAAKVARELRKLYPDADCELHFETPLELLVATILSAQSTDKRVNEITPALFSKYPRARDYADAEPAVLEEDIRSSGFFRQKTKSLIGMGKALVADHGGEVPADLAALVKLPGVARKTANVVLGTAFEIPSGFVVDTHVRRVSRRLGLTEHDQPERIEQDLMAVFPRKQWIFLGHALIWHGRRVCHARRPECEECSLAKLCPRVGLEEGSGRAAGGAKGGGVS